MRCLYLNLLLSISALLLNGCLAPTPEPAPREPSRVEIGKRIYTEGIGADGEPVEALVMGDIPVFGDQFTCLHCHRHSGIGGPEGTKYVMPTHGPALYSPRVNIYNERPAYTDATLAEVLRYGMDPGGNLLDPAMPVYDLSGEDMDALIAYLKTLSSTFSPGVDDQYLHIATVIGPDVPEAQSRAMLSVLERFFRDANGQARRPEILAEVGPFYHDYKNKAYREWKLHVWRLAGEPETWREQLLEHYREQPVFAMVSGLAATPWRPIHAFAKEQGIPSILPNTDMPALDADDDFYTLYFSGGLALEAQTVLDDVARRAEAPKLVQFHFDNAAGRYAARAMEHYHELYPEVALESRRVDDLDALSEALAQLEASTAVMLWIDKDRLLRLDGEMTPQTAPVYASSILLDRDLETVATLRNLRIAHPFNLPEDQRLRALRTRAWLTGRKLPLLDDRIQTQSWYACKVFHSGTKHIKVHFYRDYLLDAIDHSSRLGPYASNYPRLSFGPDQRYLAKGAYLIRTGAEPDSGPTAAEWRTP